MAEDTGYVDLEKLMDEGEQDFRLHDLETQDGDPTSEQIRGALGEDAEGLDDDALQKMWEDAKAPGEEKPKGEVVPEVKVGDGEKKTAPEGEVKEGEEKEGEVKEGEDGEPFTFKDAAGLFEHKINVQVDGAAKEGTIAEFVRMAQRAPMLERGRAEAVTQRNTVQGELEAAQKEVELGRKDLKWMRWMLEDESGERFLQLREKYTKGEIAGDKPVEVPSSATTESESDQRGTQYYESDIKPYIQRMARSYSGDGVAAPTVEQAQWMEKEIDRVATQLIEAEGKFLTWDRLNAIFSTDIPYQIEQSGEWKRVDIQPAVVTPTAPTGTLFTDATAPIPAAAPATGEVAGLRTELANMKTQLAKLKVEVLLPLIHQLL